MYIRSVTIASLVLSCCLFFVAPLLAQETQIDSLHLVASAQEARIDSFVALGNLNLRRTERPRLSRPSKKPSNWTRTA